MFFQTKTNVCTYIFVCIYVITEDVADSERLQVRPGGVGDGAAGRDDPPQSVPDDM